MTVDTERIRRLEDEVLRLIEKLQAAQDHQSWMKTSIDHATDRIELGPCCCGKGRAGIVAQLREVAKATMADDLCARCGHGPYSHDPICEADECKCMAYEESGIR